MEFEQGTSSKETKKREGEDTYFVGERPQAIKYEFNLLDNFI